MLLMLSFAMISQRRILSLIHLFTAQGATLVAATVLVGYATAPAAPLHFGGHHAARSR
jgi:hydrogenase-4 component E